MNPAAVSNGSRRDFIVLIGNAQNRGMVEPRGIEPLTFALPNPAHRQGLA